MLIVFGVFAAANKSVDCAVSACRRPSSIPWGWSRSEALLDRPFHRQISERNLDWQSLGDSSVRRIRNNGERFPYEHPF